MAKSPMVYRAEGRLIRANASDMRELLGLGRKGKLPPEGMPERDIQGFRVYVRSSLGGGRARKHRIYVRHECGADVPFGRLHQHKCIRATIKVLAVLTYHKYVVVEIEDPQEAEDEQGSRTPNFRARDSIIQVVDDKAKDAELEWSDSTYYKEGSEYPGYEIDGVVFESEEWFDI